MKITIAYVTNRWEPRFAWFADSLCRQTTPEQRADLQVVFVDGRLWSESQAYPKLSPEIPLADPAFHDTTRRAELSQAVRQRFDYIHIPPKPCAWQGPFRQTTKDYFCAGNQRNTAFIVAQNPYVVFVDDLSVLMPGWFNQVLHAAHDGYVVCGAYKKLKKMNVVDGELVSFEEFPAGIDSRWPRGSDGGVVPWHGTGLFGCSFGLPLEAALEVDGNDGVCNGQGAEDTDFGIRLERAGWAFFYNRNMLTVESEEDHHGSKLPQERKLVSPDRLNPAYESYQFVKPDERYWSDHVVLNRLTNETERILPLIGDDLRVLRTHFLLTGCVPIPREPQLDWRNGTPLSEL